MISYNIGTRGNILFRFHLIFYIVFVLGIQLRLVTEIKTYVAFKVE